MIRTVGRDYSTVYKVTCTGDNNTVRFGGGCGSILEFQYEDVKERFREYGGIDVYIRCPECERGIKLGIGGKEMVLRRYRKSS